MCSPNVIIISNSFNAQYTINNVLFIL
ncbi:MAG: hypothetical protein ACI93V_001354, partial [Alteromonadaceae bacterium]